LNEIFTSQKSLIGTLVFAFEKSFADKQE